MVEPFTAARRASRSTSQDVGWDVQFDRIRNAAVSGEGPDVTQAGTTQVPFFAALGGFSDLNGKVADVGGKGAYAAGHLEHDAGRGPGRHVGGAVVHRGPRDLLPQGRAQEGRRRPRDGVQGPGTRSRPTLETIKEQGRRRQADRAVRRARQEGVRPRPRRDAVRVGRPAAPSCPRTTRSRPSTRRRPSRASSSWPSLIQRRRCSTRASSSVTARRSRTSSRAAGWPSGSAARGCSARSRAPTTTRGPTRRATNVGVAPMPAGPAGKAFTFVGGSDLMVLKSLQAPGRGLGAAEVPVARTRRPEGLREPARHVPGAAGAAAAGRRPDANHKAFFEAIEDGPHVRADPAVGRRSRTPTRARFGEHPRQRRRRRRYSDAELKKQLDAAAKEADGLLAQSAG